VIFFFDDFRKKVFKTLGHKGGGKATAWQFLKGKSPVKVTVCQIMQPLDNCAPGFAKFCCGS
jgi:Fe-S cluster assembly ATPase SufC